MTQRAAMGTRGDWNPVSTPGDLTGRRLLAQASVRQDHDAALANMRNALLSDPVELVSLPGGRTYTVPREIVTHLLRVGAEEAD
jgi:hypothetical protein